jgi:hypothetical protein
MDPTVVAAIIQAAGKLYTAYADREENRRQMSEFAKLLSSANSVLITEMEKIVAKALEQQIINECTDRLQSLSVFYSENAANPMDLDKLRRIDQESQFILNRLDNPDTCIPAIHTYMGVATLRINSLALKSEFEPGDRINAINLAKTSIDYVTQVRRLLDLVPPARITLKYESGIMHHAGRREDSYFYCRVTAFLKRDGKTLKKVVWDTEEQGQDHNSMFSPLIYNNDERCHQHGVAAIEPQIGPTRDQLINEIQNSLPYGDIDNCIDSWKTFSGM